MKTLESRRSEICLTFAKKALKNDKFKEWFSVIDEMEPVKRTRYGEAQIIPTLKPVKLRTDRYERPPIPYLTNILNEYFEFQKVKS